jgi:paraquat-inducible protein B
MSVKTMTDETPDPGSGFDAPSAVKKDAGKSGFSPIWIVPIVALLIGILLLYKVLSEQGPTITISFEEASGLEPGKTVIKYRDVDVGKVTRVDLDDDIMGVTVTAELVPEGKKYLTEDTRFWVVRAQISAGRISGLGTLLSGDYIGMDPSMEGAPSKSFIGLERPPVIQSDKPGTYFTLRSEQLGGMDFGSPVYYKQIKVGQVVDYKNRDDGDITLDIFVEDPYDKHVTTHTRFWNASGVDVVVNANGVEVNTQSLVSILVGGIAFSTSKGTSRGGDTAVPEGYEFRLYTSRSASRIRKYSEKHQVMLYFEDPIRGLLPGAPVEMRGYQLGEVVDISFEFNRNTNEVKIPVIIEIEPERFTIIGEEDFPETLDTLVAQGLRAQLKTGNLVLGKLLVDLEFFPDAEPATVDHSGEYSILPTTRGTISAITEGARTLVAELRQTVAMINNMLASKEVKSGISDLSATLASVKRFSATLDETMAPQFDAVLAEAEGALHEARQMLATNSSTRTEINRVLIELGAAARSIRQLADYLEQHPESIIKGKD